MKLFYENSFGKNDGNMHHKASSQMSQIYYGMKITLYATSSKNFLGYDYNKTDDLQVSNDEPSKQTHFVLTNAAHKKDTGFVKYGDMVYLEAGLGHIVGTSSSTSSSEVKKKMEEISKLTLIKTLFPPDIINNYGRWKIQNENVWKIVPVSGGEWGVVHSADEASICNSNKI
jgi:hypothetical protein